MWRRIYLVKWEFLSIRYVKVNFDGSVKNGNITAGYVIRNYYGKVTVIGVKNLGKVRFYLRK